MAGMERKGMSVCRECMLMLQHAKRTSQLQLATRIVRQWTGRSFTSANAPAIQSRRYRDIRENTSQARVHRSFPSTARRYTSATAHDLKSLHTRILELSSTVLRPSDTRLPSEQRILYVLEQLEAIAHSLIDTKADSNGKPAKRTERDGTATSALLGSVNATSYPAFLSKAALLNLISEKVEETMLNPNTFITPSVLKSYVDLQTLLHRPSSFPAVFDLYATKPVPKLTSDGQHISYTEPSPHKINAAVDSHTTNTALTSAMTAHDLPLSIDIITTTFCTPAFKKSKLLRRLTLPLTALTAAPLTAYALATQFSLYQTTMDPAYATQIAFAGIMTYLTTVCGLGYVVVTTANDQMDRVTWAKGVPLWERWVREEERAALDRVAGRWGFEDVGKRGLEEGVEWEGLREFVGLRGMVLDRVELMEGME